MSSPFARPVTQRFWGRLTLLSLLFWGTLLTASSGHARDDVKPAPVPAQIVAEHPVTEALSPVLAALPDGRLFSLDKSGNLILLDQKTAQNQPFSQPFPNLPAFSALTGNDKGLWAITQGKTPELYQLSAEGAVKGHFPLGKVVTTTSHIPALQVGDHFAYISDEGAKALIVMDLKTHTARRLMVNYPSLIAERPYIRNGKTEKNTDGHFLNVGNVRYLALSHDGKKLFYQTPPGPFYMIETVLLNDPTTGPAELLEAMVKWRNSYCIGGLAITPDNTLYMVDVDHGDLIGVPQNHLPIRMLHDTKLTQTRDMVFIPATVSSKAKLVLLIGSSHETHSAGTSDQPLKLLITNLP